MGGCASRPRQVEGAGPPQMRNAEEEDIFSRRNTGIYTPVAAAAVQSFREQGSPSALSEPSLAQLFLSQTPCKAQRAQVHGVDRRQSSNTAPAKPHVAVAAYQVSPWASLNTAAHAPAADPAARMQAFLAGRVRSPFHNSERALARPASHVASMDGSIAELLQLLEDACRRESVDWKVLRCSLHKARSADAPNLDASQYAQALMQDSPSSSILQVYQNDRHDSASSSIAPWYMPAPVLPRSPKVPMLGRMGKAGSTPNFAYCEPTTESSCPEFLRMLSLESCHAYQEWRGEEDTLCVDRMNAACEVAISSVQSSKSIHSVPRAEWQGSPQRAISTSLFCGAEAEFKSPFECNIPESITRTVSTPANQQPKRISLDLSSRSVSNMSISHEEAARLRSLLKERACKIDSSEDGDHMVRRNSISNSEAMRLSSSVQDRAREADSPDDSNHIVRRKSLANGEAVRLSNVLQQRAREMSSSDDRSHKTCRQRFLCDGAARTHSLLQKAACEMNPSEDSCLGACRQSISDGKAAPLHSLMQESTDRVNTAEDSGLRPIGNSLSDGAAARSQHLLQDRACEMNSSEDSSLRAQSQNILKGEPVHLRTPLQEKACKMIPSEDSKCRRCRIGPSNIGAVRLHSLLQIRNGETNSSEHENHTARSVSTQRSQDSRILQHSPELRAPSSEHSVTLDNKARLQNIADQAARMQSFLDSRSCMQSLLNGRNVETPCQSAAAVRSAAALANFARAPLPNQATLK